MQHLFLFQLFDACLAPDTDGDGTGCDNMTAVIVRFNEHADSNKKRKLSDNGEAVEAATESNGASDKEPASKKPKVETEADAAKETADAVASIENSS